MSPSLARLATGSATCAGVTWASVIAPPQRDLPLDRLGDIGAQYAADVLGDRCYQLGARALDNRLQVLGKLGLEAGVGKQIDPLQYLHRHLLG